MPFQKTSLDAFEREVARIDWFANVGKDSPWDSGCVRIRNFDDWTGNMDEDNVELLGEQSQEYYDYVLGVAGLSREEELKALFKRIHDLVHSIAGRRLEFDKNVPSDEGSAQCVWCAAWDAGVVACFLALDCELPEDLQEEWAWFVEGHWPCGLEYGARGEMRRLVVL